MPNSYDPFSAGSEGRGSKYDRCAWSDPKEGFGQHPLLRPDGRNLDPEKVWSLTEDEAYALFVDYRWADNGGKPYCPRCGCLEPYSVRRRRFQSVNEFHHTQHS